MGAELPMVTAVVARMPDEEVQLAAYGSVAFPIALLVEAPIIMLLAASTALCVDHRTYLRLRRFTHRAGFALTALHAAIVFTPLYDAVARGLLGVPEAVVAPGRTGLAILLPWSWAIAYRRFQQGVLIRFEHSRDVGLGTLVRLATNATVLALGKAHGGLPGIVVGTSAISAGVLAEAVFAGWRARGVVRERLVPAPEEGAPLTRGAFLRFYVPLALTPFISLAAQPLGAASMSRMPAALTSLAAWPAVHGLVFLVRSLGLAFNEVVVTLVARPGAVPALRRFGRRLALGTSGALALVALTPLARLWFAEVSDLDPVLATASERALVLAVLMPAATVLQSWFQGVLVERRRTRAVTESVALYLAIAATVLGAGVAAPRWPGLEVTVVAFTVAGLGQALWLAIRARASLRALEASDLMAGTAPGH